MTLNDCRQFYAEEIRFAANPKSHALIDAFARVARESYLGAPPWRIGANPDQPDGDGKAEDPRQLYHNVVVAIDPSRHLNNGQPSALATWIDALSLAPGMRVFHLGCGVGYYTAIMAEVIGGAGEVIAVEIDPGLAERAKQNLAGYPNVTVHCADGVTFDPGVCDAMLINAGVTHPHPAWLNRLSENGRLAFPLTFGYEKIGGIGVMAKITRKGDRFSAQILTQVAIYNCASARNASIEPRLREVLTSREIMKWKSVRTDPHDQNETCLLHAADICLSTAAVESQPDSTSTTA
ncbi:MAG TPA: methyltransferase domain-containing protein [Bryobacteraceae bacterium]|nr:methyltransferase domain-containing protein [Bryobacteraceae bacterium]